MWWHNLPNVDTAGWSCLSPLRHRSKLLITELYESSHTPTACSEGLFGTCLHVKHRWRPWFTPRVYQSRVNARPSIWPKTGYCVNKRFVTFIIVVAFVFSWFRSIVSLCSTSCWLPSDLSVHISVSWWQTCRAYRLATERLRKYFQDN